MSPVLASYRPIEFRDENNATAHTLRQKTDMEQLSDDEELTLLTRIRRFYGHSLLWTHDCMVSGVNPIALSVFAVDPGIVTGNSLPAESGADPSMSLFAELLQQAAPMIEDPDAAPAAGADGIPKTAARDSSLVLDAIAGRNIRKKSRRMTLSLLPMLWSPICRSCHCPSLRRLGSTPARKLRELMRGRLPWRT